MLNSNNINLKYYYLFKKLIPRVLQIKLRRILAKRKRRLYQNVWPIKEVQNPKPRSFTGWPEGKRFAIVLRHDVEKRRGYNRINNLMKVDEEYDFKSSFNIVPGLYEVSQEVTNDLINNGYEIGIHGWKHDGLLYFSRNVFMKRSQLINSALKKFNSVGFYSPSSHHRLEWIHDLNILYDSSTFDTDPFEPQPQGVDTIFPFIVSEEKDKKSYVEIPYTLPQDHTLFIILKEPNIDLWINKLNWIVSKGGMVCFNTHPDYMHFAEGKKRIDEYDANLYRSFLEYIKEEYNGEYYNFLPKQIAKYWLEINNCCSNNYLY